MEIGLRILQVIDFLLIGPMMCLGLMAGLSGGGLTPALQQVGTALLVVSPILAVVAIVAAEILLRVQLPIIGYVALAIPLLFWVAGVVWLQITTRFFF